MAPTELTGPRSFQVAETIRDSAVDHARVRHSPLLLHRSGRSAGSAGAALGNGDDEWPGGLDGACEPLSQAQHASALSLDGEPAKQGDEHGGHSGGTVDAQDQWSPPRTPGSEGLRNHRNQVTAGHRDGGDVRRPTAA